MRLMEKFCPTERIEGDTIYLGDPIEIEEPPQAYFTLGDLLKGLLGGGIVLAAFWAVDALADWLGRKE